MSVLDIIDILTLSLSLYIYIYIYTYIYIYIYILIVPPLDPPFSPFRYATSRVYGTLPVRDM